MYQESAYNLGLEVGVIFSCKKVIIKLRANPLGEWVSASQTSLTLKVKINESPQGPGAKIQT